MYVYTNSNIKVASRRRMQESSDEEDELNSSANESESDSDEEFAHEKKKTLQRKSAATSAVLETSSQLLEPLDENILNTQNSLYGNSLYIFFGSITKKKCLD